jgi:hypothetical protein
LQKNRGRLHKDLDRWSKPGYTNKCMSIVSPDRGPRSLVLLAVLLLVVITAQVSAVVYPFTGPVFGLAIAPDSSLLVADAGAGIFEIRKGQLSRLATLPGVSDVAPIGRGTIFASTSRAFGGDGKVYRVSGGSPRAVADLFEFESRVNPDGGIIDTNPFDIEVLNGASALVADAAANALLIVSDQGEIDWIATLPTEIVSTAHAQALYGCPQQGPEVVCNNTALHAEGVATSVAVGPDGAYYVGELKGIPAPKGESRIWRIAPGTRHARCGSSPACTVVADGFTSIVDLSMGSDNRLFVAELDEESWLAMQLGKGKGGSVNVCDVRTWQCTQIATGLPMLSSAAVDGSGQVFTITNALIPGLISVSVLP